MVRLVRKAWERMALVGAVVLIGASLAGCGDEGGENGSGEGPSACAQTCSDGRSCNPDNGRCECSSSPDSCEPFGQVCNTLKLCVPKPPPAGEIKEWAACSTPDELSADGDFHCLPVTNETNQWVRVCESDAACTDRTTICTAGMAAGDRSICWFNSCGDDAVETDASGEPVLGSGGEPTYLNGRNWGPCSTDSGPDQRALGSCLPVMSGGRVSFLCHASGERRAGEWCLPDVERNDWEGCVQGQHCAAPLVYLSSCRFHADCPSSQLCGEDFLCHHRDCIEDGECGAGNYCTERKCMPLGSCVNVCNGGSAGPEAGEYASCGEEERCNGGLPDNPGTLPHVAGFCQSGCDLLDSEACSNEQAASTCVVAPTPSNPMGGTCEAIPAHATIVPLEKLDGTYTGGELEPCGNVEICPNGLTCASAGGGQPACYWICECEGEGGWDAFGACKTSAPQCTEGRTCTQMRAGNDHLGACVPRGDEVPE